MPDGVPIPTHPAELSGWPRFLWSFTKSPMRVRCPFAIGAAAMRVVYWARWADATGDYGNFSETCVARYEGSVSAVPALPAGARRGNASTAVVRVAAGVERKYMFIEQPIIGWRVAGGRCTRDRADPAPRCAAQRGVSRPCN